MFLTCLLSSSKKNYSTRFTLVTRFRGVGGEKTKSYQKEQNLFKTLLDFEDYYIQFNIRDINVANIVFINLNKK